MTVRTARRPTTRPVRAPAIALRPPLRVPPRRQPRTLEETLVSVGIVPRSHLRGTHGLLRRWFAYESMPFAIGNAVASGVLLAVALTMTSFGMKLAVSLNAAATIYVVLNDGLPYLGIALLASAVLKAIHAWFAHKARLTSRVLGYFLALLLLAGGVWLEVMLGYADFVPWMFKPVLSVAGGEAGARIAAFDAALISYFEPALAGGLGLLLAAKQIKSGIDRHAPQNRKRIAFAGIVLSLSAAIVAAHAAQRHYTGADARDGMSFAIGGETIGRTLPTYGSLFADGVPCHVSSLYGYRDDPITPGRAEKHQGVDLAVKEGTPVHAMADGRILFAEGDPGLGNFTALQVDGPGSAPTIVNGHMSRLLVRAGDVVHRGDVIGLAGSTGRSTGPHVHLQICSGAHARRGGFVCGESSNPYENWPTLAALARMSCVSGPSVF